MALYSVGTMLTVGVSLMRVTVIVSVAVASLSKPLLTVTAMVFVRAGASFDASRYDAVERVRPDAIVRRNVVGGD